MLTSSNIKFLNSLATGSVAERKKLLAKASNNDLNAISELCLNLIRGNIKIDAKTKVKFKKHQNAIQSLANKRLSYKKKKKIINQRGSAGFLFPLASIGLPLISNIISSQIKRILK